ncbi:lactamase [Fomitiporia mediterranea MF3/22]|uniref:lactamase n=1 Tax=Fomitiporia mediterranea (strain MF3/22) TaxID=694068 RepID=UPI000440987D|nr:lactamase [Fomitiporia mediterranea MF3/22]EJD06285.1 lactamase [Fomitiporia mediterranea MF3/22]
MEVLKSLQNVTRLSSHVVRVLGQNPGKFTLQGTNTYLVGKSPPFILIDTGEGRGEYLPILESALLSTRDEVYGTSQPGRLVSDIVITHRHHDHYGGVPDVLKLLQNLHGENNVDMDNVRPRIHKYPSPPETIDCSDERDLQSVLSRIPKGVYYPSPSGSVVHDLQNFQQLETVDKSASLEIIHTPGHTPDSICLLLRSRDETEARPNVLFSADSVLGQGTAVFEDLGMYIHSLQQLLARRNDSGTGTDFKLIYPGHGPVVEDGPGLVATYIKHRLERESQIIEVLNSGPPTKNNGDDGSSAWTIWDIVGQIYKDYPENLWLPAAHSVELHLKKLEVDGRVRCLGGDGVKQRWVLLSRL